MLFVCILGQNEDYCLVAQKEEFIVSQVHMIGFSGILEGLNWTYKIMSYEHMDEVFLLYFPIPLKSKSNIWPCLKCLISLDLVLWGKNDVFFKFGTISRLQGVFPPSRMLFNFKCKKVLFKDFFSPSCCFVWGTDGTKACDNRGKIEGCYSEVICLHRLNKS